MKSAPWLIALVLSLSPSASAREPASWEPLINFLGSRTMMLSLQRMEEAQLTAGRATRTPWSGWDWFLILGGISAPYAEPGFPNSFDSFEENDKFIASHQARRHPIALVLASSEVDRLSPAEKYDLLTGDTSFFLTESVNNALRSKARVMLDWEGRCEGWALASAQLSEPRRPFVLKSAFGQPIRFYPDDVKALLSYFGAEAIRFSRPSETAFIGARCRSDRSPYTQECFDINPAELHLALVNSLGVDHTSLAADIAGGVPVYERVISEYRYTLFNPVSLEENLDLRRAKVGIASARSAYASRATSWVGVSLDFRYNRSLPPSHGSRHSAAETDGEWKRLRYFLELNRNDEVLGGEWVDRSSFDHPDFIWKPAAWDWVETNASWDGKGALPGAWRDEISTHLRLKTGPALYGPLLKLMLELSQ